MQDEMNTNSFNCSFVCFFFLLVALRTIEVVAIIRSTIKLIIQQCVFIVYGLKVCVISSCPNIYANQPCISQELGRRVVIDFSLQQQQKTSRTQILFDQNCIF